MNDTSDAFDQQFVQGQALTPALRHEYNIAVANLLGRKLSSWERLFAFAGAVVAAGSAGWVLVFALPKVGNLGFLFRVLGFLSLALTLGVAVYLSWLAVKGWYSRAGSNACAFVGILAAAFAGALFVNEACSGSDPALSNGWMVAGVTLLVCAAGSILLTLLEHYHLSTQEKLLRLECRLAEMSKKLEQILRP